jgi:hypothetical protein
MSYRLRIRLAAAQWYNERQLGLGEKFVREVDQAIVRILENPLAFPVILRRHEVRRVLTKRFPYRIFFSLKDDAVVVHAVLHLAEDEGLVGKKDQAYQLPRFLSTNFYFSASTAFFR